MWEENVFRKKYKKILVLACTILFLITAGITPITLGADNEEEINYYFIQFNQQINPDIIHNLEESFVNFEFYYQNNTYLVKMNENMINEILSLSSVDSLKPYLPLDKISPDLQNKAGKIKLKVVLHRDADIMKTIEEFNNFNIQIEKTNEICQNYILCSCDSEYIDGIASIKNVYWIGEFNPPMTCMNLITSNAYIGIDTPQVGGYRGAGVLAEVQDNGIDRSHGDLGQIIFTDGTIVAGAHGTCTSGIVFGNGNGDIDAQGIAYQATGAFSRWDVGRALSISNLWNGNFNEGSAGMNGIVQSNSWSQGPLDGQYFSNTAIVDQAAVNFPHVLSAWAAANSNDGTAEGLISRDSIAKNVICVGGVYHKDTASLADDEYLDNGAGATPSRGPAADDRQKPDLCGPFDWIHTTDATVVCIDDGLADRNPDLDGYVHNSDYYDNFGGTSGATPVIAGSAVLTYDMYQDNYFGNNPTGDWPFSSTVKALLIADAYQYPLTSASRNVQGWGTPDMKNMYNLGETYHIIEEYPEPISSGEVWSRSFYVDGIQPLKATLAWIDPAAPASTGSARSLINNLDLRIESPSGTVYWGNNGLDDSLWSDSGSGVNHWSTTNAHRDDLNNVENVFIQSPEKGFWIVEVRGRTGGIPQGPQDFSLVISGALNNEITKGLCWLRDQQNPDGSWTYSGRITEENVGLTSIATASFLNYGIDESDSTVNDAINWILSKQQSDGKITNSWYHAYDTSLAVLALVATGNNNYYDEIQDATNFLISLQNDEGEGYTISDHCYGGWPYWEGMTDWADLSNGQFVLLALHYAEQFNSGDTIVSNDVWDKAETFVTRCQNRESSNPDYNFYDDGGFIYGPGYSTWAWGMSYGSMTAAGLWGLYTTGVPPTDGRLQDAWTWIQNHYFITQNYPIGITFLYYYLYGLAKACILWDVETISSHNWYEEMSQVLVNNQQPDGHWPGTDASEEPDNVATCWALLALESKQIPKNTLLHFEGASPVDLHVYDPLGRHVGIDYDTGMVENEIPGATYSGPGTSPQIIEIPDPIAGTYITKLVGTGDGSFTFTVRGLLNGVLISEDSFTGYITEDEVRESHISVSSLAGAITVEILDLDLMPPQISIITPNPDDALQDGITFLSLVTDLSGVSWVKYSIRLPDGGTGTIIDPMFESISATDIGGDIWQLLFDTTQLPDGYYLLFVNASDLLGNIGYETVEFSIRNWAVLELLPNTPNSKAGRTMPIKFSLRVTEAVDPSQPFVRNEELTILIYEKGHPETILQESIFGGTSTDYRINLESELYITNFKTLKTPKTYVVEIWRNDLLIGSFEFVTVK